MNSPYTIETVTSNLFAFSTQSEPFIIAEISANHSGKIENCFKLIDTAISAGASAVKFQTYTANSITLDSDLPDFKISENSPWRDFGSLYKLYEKAYTPWEWHKDLFDYCKDKKIISFSSAFDETSVEFLESLNTPFHKLASPEINHIPLIKCMAKTRKPILLSLGVASEKDLDLAIETIKSESDSEIIIMQCDTAYPAESFNSNINLLSYLSKKFPYTLGLSDHTLNSISAITAVALGAKVFEKHLALNDEESVDSFFSTSASEFQKYVLELKEAYKTLGKPIFRINDSQIQFPSKRSVYPTRDIQINEMFTEENIKVLRPGFSLSPSKYEWLLGKKASRLIKRGERIKLDDVSE